MNVDIWRSSPELPFFPLPLEHLQSIRAGLIRRDFSPNAIRSDHEFTASNKTGRLKVNCVAFTDELHCVPDTAAMALYYDPEGRIADETILDQMAFSNAPFVFIGRKEQVLPYGISGLGGTGSTRIGDAIPYYELENFFERYQADINPSRITAVKSGAARFIAFPQLNPVQLRLWTFDITRDLLAENFGHAVGLLREEICDRPSLDLDERVLQNCLCQTANNCAA
jgi:hypothetical protein